jgi:hypothetical protein
MGVHARNVQQNYQWFQCLPLAILSNWNAAQLALSINLITLIFILWCFSPRFWTRSSVISLR